MLKLTIFFLFFVTLFNMFLLLVSFTKFSFPSLCSKDLKLCILSSTLLPKEFDLLNQSQILKYVIDWVLFFHNYNIPKSYFNFTKKILLSSIALKRDRGSSSLSYLTSRVSSIIFNLHNVHQEQERRRTKHHRLCHCQRCHQQRHKLSSSSTILQNLV